MSKEADDVLPQLEHPPINEVICGFLFEGVQTLDPMLLGLYWNARRDEYPGRELRPALVSDGSFVIGSVPPIRVWLISKDEQFVLQLQQDRFYMNWRARGGKYPRFSDRDSRKGLMSMALGEFAKFAKFVQESTGTRIVPAKLELAKIDLFVEKVHWKDRADLAQLIPWMRPLVHFASSSDPSIAVQFREEQKEGDLRVSFASAMLADGKSHAIQLDSRVIKPVAPSDSVERTFQAANNQLNRVFIAMIEPAEMKRFGIAGAGK